MDFQEILAQRHSCRKYRSEPVPRELLLQIAEAGRRSPSGCNLQPWRFILVDEAEKRAAIAKAVYDETTKVNGFAVHIPAFIVIVHMPPADIGDLQRYLVGQCNPRYLSGVDIGCAGMEMSMAATNAGLGSVLMGMINEPIVRQALSIPDCYDIPLILGLGYPEKKAPPPRPRRPLADIIRWNQFDDSEG